MTLACAILLLSISSATPATVTPRAQSPAASPQATSPDQSENTQATQQQSQTAQTPPEENKNSVADQTSAPAGKKPKRRSGKSSHRHKKPPISNCDPAAAKLNAPAANSGTATPTGATPSQATGTTAAPTNCPPSKIVVRQGGITEQSIQLAGGAGGDQASKKRDAASHMLATTQDNLKKIAGRQLSASQQETVSQIRQFADQSKSALESGDFERAQTLAWKAQLLSEDLVNPKQ